jgi:hypothetical protein
MELANFNRVEDVATFLAWIGMAASAMPRACGAPCPLPGAKPKTVRV